MIGRNKIYKIEEDEDLTKEERSLAVEIRDKFNEWLEDETRKENELERKFRKSNLTEYKYEDEDDFYEIYNYDDTDYDDGLDGREI